MAIEPEYPWERSDGAQFSIGMGSQNRIVNDGSRLLYTPYITGIGSQGPSGEIQRIPCEECGSDELTGYTTVDNKVRCIKCHDKFMLAFNERTCTHCKKPVQYASIDDDGKVYCNECFEEHERVPVDIQRLCREPKPERPEMDAGETRSDAGFKLSPKVLVDLMTSQIRLNKGMCLDREICDVPIKGKPKSKQPVAQGIRGPKGIQGTRGPKGSVVTKDDIDKMRDELLNYDFTDDNPKRKTKPRKPKTESKVGGWFKKIAANVKEGWQEMMDEGKEPDSTANETNETKEKDHGPERESNQP